MKKKTLFLLLIICIGLFIPKEVFALQIYNNVNIDYAFFVDEDENNAGKLKFKLYDKSKTLNFESEYDFNAKKYYFEYNENNFTQNECYQFFGDEECDWHIIDYSNYDFEYRPYVPYLNEFGYLINHHNIVGKHNDDWFGTWDAYTYIPMILEESTTHYKKIIFASITFRSAFQDFVHVILVNNTTKFKEEPISLGDSFLDNVDFMRKTSLDYSDELWEELNNEPIASSEIYTNNINSVNYKYKNKSVSSDQYNLPEESIDDYANSLPVFSLKKEENKPNSVIPNIVNPKTWTNGVILLIISIIIIGGSGFVLIKKKS